MDKNQDIQKMYIGYTKNEGCQREPKFNFGSRGRIRTSDKLINSQQQLPLCYSGTKTNRIYFSLIHFTK